MALNTNEFEIQFNNYIPESGYKVEGYVCNANNARDCKAVILRTEPFHKVDYSVMGEYWTLGFSSVLLLWLFSTGVGQVIKMVRNA